MSYPPSPTTSTRAATISSHKERRSTSFPSLGSFNPFRSKSAPQPSIPAEPFLVAPGIWSTDATAQVFGYLDPWTSDNSKIGRTRSAGPHKRNRSQTPESGRRRPLPAKNFVSRYKEVHKDDGTDDFSNRTHRRQREAWERARQRGRDEARSEREESDRRSRRDRMRSMSQDDQLTERGANPRTGVISPFITSEDSGNGVDYMSKGCDRSPTTQGSRRTSSGRWKQDGGSWSFVENAVPSPTKLSAREQPNRQVSVKKIQDKLLAQMPGADNTEPDNMTTEQIGRYQQSVENACKFAGGSHAMLDPETLPTPRILTPEGPSTPPTKLQKIRRKEVGSALKSHNRSDDTTIINPKQRSASTRPQPTIRIPSMDKQQVRIISPSMAALGVPPRTPLDIPTSFLGHPQQCYRTVSAGQFQSTHPLSPQTNQEARHHQARSQAERRGPAEAPFVPRASSPTLNQSLPCLQFLRPSHFANLESSSYRRPAHLLPPSLRSGPQKRQLVEDAATITTTITSPKRAPRPSLQRQEGSNVVLRASHQNLDNQIRRRDRYHTNVRSIKMLEPTEPAKTSAMISNATSGGTPRSPPYPCFPNLEGTEEIAPKANPHDLGDEMTRRDHLRVNIPAVRVFAPTDSPQHAEDFQDVTADQIHHTRQYPSTFHPNGAEGVAPQANHHQLGNRETTQDRIHANAPLAKDSMTSKPTLDTLDSQPRPTHLSPQYRSPSNPDGVAGAVQAGRVAMLGDVLHQHQHQSRGPQLRKRGGQAASSQRPNVGNARSTASEESRDRDGITPTFDHRGEGNVLAATNGNIMGDAVRAKELVPVTELVPNNEGGVCFVGNWADASDDTEQDSDDSDDSNVPSITTAAIQAEEILTRRRSLIKKGQDIAQWLATIEGLTQPKAYLNYAQQSLWHMVIHVASTLHHGSPAFKVLRSTDAKVGSREYLNAVKEVALAGFYLLVLLNFALVLRKVVTSALRVVYWVWHPFTAVGVIIRWCLIT